MRNARRSKRQLEKTSHWRSEVFKFMERFNAKHLWTCNGVQDTDIDEMFCFAWEGGVVIIQTWCHGGWSIYTQPTKSGDLDITEAAMRAQLLEEPEYPAADIDPGIRIPVEGMTPDGFVGNEDRLSPEDEAHLFATGHLPEDF